MISIIAAMGSNQIIGNKGNIPWKLPEDLARFERLTKGCPIIMGRKTYESIGRPLGGRINVILSRNPEYQVEGAETATSLEEALRASPGSPTRPTWIIGGEQVYREAFKANVVDNIFLTEVNGIFPGDARFPIGYLKTYREVSKFTYPTHVDRLYVRA